MVGGSILVAVLGSGVARAALQDVLGHRAFVMPIAAQIQFGRAGVGCSTMGWPLSASRPTTRTRGQVLQSLQPGLQVAWAIAAIGR